MTERLSDRDLRRIERQRGLQPGLAFSGAGGQDVIAWIDVDADPPARQATLGKWAGW